VWTRGKYIAFALYIGIPLAIPPALPPGRIAAEFRTEAPPSPHTPHYTNQSSSLLLFRALLQRLLTRFDSVGSNMSYHALAVEAILQADPAHQIPRWLLRSCGVAWQQGPGDDEQGQPTSSSAYGVYWKGVRDDAVLGAKSGEDSPRLPISAQLRYGSAAAVPMCGSSSSTSSMTFGSWSGTCSNAWPGAFLWEQAGGIGRGGKAGMGADKGVANGASEAATERANVAAVIGTERAVAVRAGLGKRGADGALQPPSFARAAADPARLLRTLMAPRPGWRRSPHLILCCE
jgi:hypothetical protein